ncbi:MAG: TetR/AcrR family transcriptional regulator [Myxococcales bacterium]|nr:TetR/AcrR family transcriptional regulator [Myxococcales bacterium]
MNTPVVELEWVKTPRQARSQQTLERLLQAAEDLIQEKGFEGATISEIARRAKSSVGAFYARFSDKDGLLRTLDEQFFRQAVATFDVALDAARWDGVSIADCVYELVRFAVRVFEERRGLLLAVAERIRFDSSYLERRTRLVEEIVTRLDGLLVRRGEELTHPDPRVGVDFVVRLILGALEQRAVYGSIPGVSPILSNGRFAAELTRAALGYLGVPIEGVPQRWN